MNEPTLVRATVEAEMLAARGAVDEDYRLLLSASRDDAQAAMTLGLWRMSGHRIRRDIGLARDLFGHAAELGLDAAEDYYIALLANGAGGLERRWQGALDRLRRRAPHNQVAHVQLAVLSAMSLTDSGDPATSPAIALISRQPRVATITQFMTHMECRYVSLIAEPLLGPSTVVHPATGALVQDPIRSSTAASFPFVAEDPVLHALNRCIAAVTQTLYEQGEPMQVLSYGLGQEYKLHSDALPHEPNPRITTLLVYLNEDFRGGETHFPRANLSHRGRTGDALVFDSVAGDGSPDRLAWHAGLPVSAGRKLILSKWIRAEPLDLTGPSARPF